MDGFERAGEVISGLVLAAGGGTRFGTENKLLAPLHGRYVLEYALAAMADAELASVVCVLGARADEIAEAVDFHGATAVVCSDWAEGQSVSLRVGIDALHGSDAVVVTLGDQPLVTSEAIDRVVARRGREVPAVQATYGGVPGHPVVLERELYPQLRKLRGDRGAGKLISQLAPRRVSCDGLGSPRDIDSRRQLAEVAALIASPEGDS